MNYQEAIEFLHDLTKFGFNFGLDRIKTLLELLGSPHQELKTVHIGGTNGKGSTAAMTTSILKAAGKSTGLYTSPHLDSYRERIQINGEMISESEMAGLLTEVRPHLEEMVVAGHEHPTEFEVITAVALLYFKLNNVDVALVEVGLGGLIDSTNVVNPLVSVITNVGMDHMDYLGNSLDEITRIKAGIIRKGTTLVTAAVKPEVLSVIEEICEEKQSPLIRVGRDVTLVYGKHSLAGQHFSISTGNRSYDSLELPLLGRHQVTNAAMAVAIIEELGRQGFDIPSWAVSEGLRQVRWPARLELIAGHPPVLVDAAHNFDGALTLAGALRDYFPEEKIVLLIGMLADKEREKVLGVLAPLAEKIVITKPNSPRAGRWQQMGEEARRYTQQVVIEENIAQAANLAIQAAGTTHLLCITGSFYMVAEVRKHILESRN
ncbi:bifunctional folylpolyglutamate synthase/dihydrofolate synthase [Metallumcola ferriviriculae]|uniref:tetrahydrofolate synthase n=1 Tax=Metallumcola ferriviriculae TaxID=3039180 RepID=A0AAU0ULF9_9FIRM|nr:bifunctional folylpolyglutamate synthase/dihydrofolate synthase [Desulfitibacteraceae bacterium MK1]